MNDYATGFTIKATPEQVYAAINDVRGWWTGAVEGATDQRGAEFRYSHRDLHTSLQRIAEMTPSRRVVWDVIDAQLTFVGDQTEWIGTKIVFDIAPKGDETELRFTHVGLKPTCECYKACSGGWTYFIDGSLKIFIETGEGLASLG